MFGGVSPGHGDWVYDLVCDNGKITVTQISAQEAVGYSANGGRIVAGDISSFSIQSVTFN